MIEIPGKTIMESLRDNPDVRYAAKHAVESHIQFHGGWQIDWLLRGRLISDPLQFNTFTIEGLARMLNILFWTASKPASLIWYVGLYKINVTPNSAHTAAACLGAAGTYGALQAVTDFTGSAYPSYETASTATASITNSATQKAVFTFADEFTVYGAFLGTASDPTDTSGYLMSAKKLTKARDVESGDGSAIAYTVSVTTS